MSLIYPINQANCDIPEKDAVDCKILHITTNYVPNVMNVIDSNFTSMIFYYLDTSVGMVYSSEYDFKSNQHREENDNKGIANECSSFTIALISVAVLSLMSLLITLYTYMKQQRVAHVMESSWQCRPKCHIWDTQDDPYLVCSRRI